MSNQEETQAEHLERELYKVGARSRVNRSDLSHPSPTSGQDNWPLPKTPQSSPRAKKRHSLFDWLLVVSIVFFIVSGSVAVYVFYGGGNVISSDNIEIMLSGPQIVRAGDTLDLQVLITNRNPVPLNSADLIIEYPSGTRAPGEISNSLTRERIPLETINSSETTNRMVHAVVFGEKGKEQSIRVAVEYRLEDSNAIFDRTEFFKYLISDSPLALTVDAPKEASVGRAFNLHLTLVSNATSPLSDVALEVDYPPGFTFEKATPMPVGSTDNFWRLGDLPPGGRVEIELSGSLDAQQGDTKSFRSSVGLSGVNNQVDLVYDEVFSPVTVEHPAVSMSFVLNGDEGDKAVASSGEAVKGEVSWYNSLPTEILDGQIKVIINGQTVDERSISVSDGFYQSADNSIVWNKGTRSEFARLGPGASGKVNFNFTTRSLVQLGGSQLVKNPTVDFDVYFSGRQIVTGEPDRPVEVNLRRELKINSVLQLAAAASYRSGPFTNSGPLPPRANSETSYTITWSVINSSNTVDNATVKTTLPPYVRWLGFISPTTEAVKFSSLSNEVVWNLGSIEAGLGVSSAAREASFQIALKPSASQINQTPAIIGVSTLLGHDSFTGQSLGSEKRALDTSLTNDPGFRSGEERVGP